MNTKKILKIGGIVLGSILLVVLLICGIQYLRVKFAKIEVVLVEDLTIEFASEKHVSDFITSINGTITNDYLIDSTTLGIKEVKVDFKNDDGIKVQYVYHVEVKDTVAPVIWLSGSYTINKGTEVDLVSKILCGDNEDARPNCYIEGEYDYNTVGTYPLTFKAEDKSGNVSEQKFNLRVVEPPKTNGTTQTLEPSKTYFSDIVENFKTENTRIGIDVSKWQGEIDFEQLKNAGVEFMMIRLGGTRGTNKEYFIDETFEQNIKKATEYGIDVGIYFYSYANSNEHAKRDAEWVIEQLKDYKITLPIAFDWENWSSFNDYNLSFFGLTDMAHTFLETIENAGYKGLLYSSKNYLERIWLPTKYDTWLAHYTKKTNYEGNYTFWQLCSDGRVDGIKGAVDIDILYLDK